MTSPTTMRAHALTGFGDFIPWPQVRNAYVRSVGHEPTDKPHGVMVGGQLQVAKQDADDWINDALKARQQREAEGRDDDGLTAQQREELQADARERAAHREAMELAKIRERHAHFRACEASNRARDEADAAEHSERRAIVMKPDGSLA